VGERFLEKCFRFFLKNILELLGKNILELLGKTLPHSPTLQMLYWIVLFSSFMFPTIYWL